jgi:hypothetical protein
MAKLDKVGSKRAGETGSRDTVFGVAGMVTSDPLLQASNRMLEGWMAVSSEIFEFGKTRFDRGLETSRAMAQSTSLNEAIEVQTKYTRSIMQDYLSEANKIADLTTRSLLDSFSNLQQARDKQTRDITPHGEAAG